MTSCHQYSEVGQETLGQAALSRSEINLTQNIFENIIVVLMNVFTSYCNQ